MEQKRRSDHIHYRYGICLNDNCEKAKNKEVQRLSPRLPFVCEQCGKPLRECPPPKKKNYKLPLIIAGVLVVCIVVACIIIFTGSKNNSESVTPEKVLAIPDSVDVKDSTAVKTVVTHDTIVVKDTVVEMRTTVDKQITTKKATDSKSKKESSKSSATSHHLAYGTWNGGWKNGKPHGTGTMTYSVAHLIDDRDSKGRTASPGEYVIGEWDNGRLVQGRWFKKDGNKEVIILGKAG